MYKPNDVRLSAGQAGGPAQLHGQEGSILVAIHGPGMAGLAGLSYSNRPAIPLGTSNPCDGFTARSRTRTSVIS